MPGIIDALLVQASVVLRPCQFQFSLLQSQMFFPKEGTTANSSKLRISVPGNPPYEWTQSIPPLGKVFSPGLAGATTLNSPTGGCPSTWNKGLDHLCPPKKLASTTTCPVSFCFSCSNIYFVAFPLLDVSQDAFTTIILGAAPLFYCESIQFQAHFLSIFKVRNSCYSAYSLATARLPTAW